MTQKIKMNETRAHNYSLANQKWDWKSHEMAKNQ